MEERDVLVIGAGPAGYAAAIRAAQLGGKVTIVEKEALGGTCLNSGCIPTRVFARAAELLETGSHGKDYGITFHDQIIDFSKLIARKEVVVKTLVAGVRTLLRENGVETEEGTAAFVNARELSITAPDGSRKTILARNTIIAPGARCRDLPFSGGDLILDTTATLQLKEIPHSMVILGAGCIGMSLASVFSKLGTTVTVLEESNSMLNGIDGEIVSLYQKEARKAKIAYYPECRIQAIEHDSNGGMRVLAKAKGEELILNAQCIVNAEKREANSEGLGLADLGVTLNERNGVAVDKAMRTSIAGVFAAGDVTMEHMWTHVAYMEGVVAAENAMGRASYASYGAVPYWACTVPSVAGVGFTEEEAVAMGYDVKSSRCSFGGNGMAMVLGQRVGMVKVITERKYGQVLGVHIVGPRADELIAEAAMAVKCELTPLDIGAVLHPHPSLSEAFWEAARSAAGSSIHLLPEK
jgi:dihydrolipoamide dehydrogenase